MRVIIAGCRDFTDYSFVRERLDFYFQNNKPTEIISGGQRGVDALGERYADERGIPLNVSDAKWGEYGKAAGPIRNAEMAKCADALIAFWDSQSDGTRNMIQTARNKKLNVRVVNIPTG